MVDVGRIGFHTLRGVIQSAILEFLESAAFPRIDSFARPLL